MEKKQTKMKEIEEEKAKQKKTTLTKGVSREKI